MKGKQVIIDVKHYNQHFESFFFRMLQTLQALKSICINRRQEPPKLIQVLFGQRTLGKPNEQQQRSIKFYNNDLNEDQKEAVRFSLTSPEVALIHGPPGKFSSF